MSTAHIQASPLFISTPVRAAASSKSALWTGRVLSGLAALFLTFDASIKVFGLLPKEQADNSLGFALRLMAPIGWIEVACLALYLMPRTAVLGAVLWTGYLGGAIASHVRAESPLLSHTLFPIYIAVLIWGGLYLRDARVRAMIAKQSQQIG